MISTKDYGLALYELAREEALEETLLEELRQVSRLLQQDPDYLTLLDSPAVPIAQRLRLLDEAMGSVSLWHLNFMKLLCQHRAMGQYPECAREYEALYRKAHNIMEATAITALPLTKEQSDKLTGRLETLTGKTVELHNVVDPGVLGGVTLRYEGLQLDGSLRSRLKELQDSLNTAIV